MKNLILILLFGIFTFPLSSQRALDDRYAFPENTSFTTQLEKLSLQKFALTVVASGFVDPLVNSDLYGFGIWITQPNTGEMIALLEATTTVKALKNIEFTPYTILTHNAYCIDDERVSEYYVFSGSVKGVIC